MIIKKFLKPADGKINLKCKLLNPKTKTLKLLCSPESGFLCLDVDEPNSKEAQQLKKYVDFEKDFIVKSKNNGRYKVIFEYWGKPIPKKKTNTNVEVFYGNNKLVGIAGKYDDNVDYTFSGKIRKIDFNINDCLQTKVPFNFLKQKKFEKSETQNKNCDIINNVVNDQEQEQEKVEINEFEKIIDGIVKIPKIIKKNNLLTFDCIFSNEHNKKNYAYAFKKNGIYTKLYKMQSLATS